MIHDGPFKSAVEASRDKIIKQELVTYYINEEGSTCKETATRKFFTDDYVDSTSNENLSLR